MFRKQGNEIWGSLRISSGSLIHPKHMNSKYVECFMYKDDNKITINSNDYNILRNNYLLQLTNYININNINN